MNRLRIALPSFVAGLLTPLVLVAPAAAQPESPRDREGLVRRADELALRGFNLDHDGKRAEGTRLMEEALAIYRRLYPPAKYPSGDENFAILLHNLANVLAAQGRADRADELYAEAVAMCRHRFPKGKQPPGNDFFINLLVNFGQLVSQRGEYARAEPLFREALAVSQALYPGAAPAVSLCCSSLGDVLQAQGDFAAAETFYRQALEISRALYPKEKFPGGHVVLAIGLNNLGMLLHTKGEFDQAFPLCRESLDMRRALYPKEKYPSGHPYISTALTNLAAVFQSRGQYDQAEELLREALEMDRALLKRNSDPASQLFLAASLNNYAGVLERRREYARAEPFFRECLEIHKRLYPRGHAEVARSLNNLGFVLAAQGKTAEAEGQDRAALAMYRTVFPKDKFPDGHADLARALLNLGALRHAQGDVAEAESDCREALAMFGRIADRNAELLSEAEALNHLATLPLARDLLLQVTRGTSSAAAVYAAVWHSKAALTRIVERRQLDVQAAKDEETRRLGLELRTARQRLARLAAAPLADPEQHTARLRQLTAAKEELEKQLTRRLHLSRDDSKPRPGQPDELIRRLPEKTAFVDVLRYGSADGVRGETVARRYAAFVLRPGQPVRRVELGDAGPIETAARAWCREIAQALPAAQAGRTLGELVWRPLAEHIPADVDTVFIAPDGELASLPWAALPGRGQGRVVLEEHAVAFVPHGPWLADRIGRPPGREDGPGAVAAVGAVAYGAAPRLAKPLPEGLSPADRLRGRSQVEWVELPGTKRELDQVVGRAGRRAILLRQGADAGVSQVCDDLETARFAHLATHGFFDERGTTSVLQLAPGDFLRGRRGERIGAAQRSPLLRCGLVLAGANRKDTSGGETWAPDGGILLAEAIATLDLRRLELAVLSACETGLGEVAAGEGVFGLQRAFHLAGCRTVVGSLWRVNDAATSALMTKFYHELWVNQKPALAALREAQLTIYHHPELIPDLAGERGAPRLKDGVAVKDGEPARPQAARADTRLWAAFVLSGVGN